MTNCPPPPPNDRRMIDPRELAAAIDELARRISAAVSLPPTVLFGEAPNCRCVGTPRSNW